MLSRIGIAALCATLATTSAAAAQAPRSGADAASPAAKSEAITRFKRGLALYDERDFAGALSELRRAYALAPAFGVLFNIGQVCFELKDHACALRSFQGYLRGGGAAISDERRASIEADIAQLELRVGRIAVGTNVAGVEIAIDDVACGVTPLAEAVLVNAGRHRVTAEKHGLPPLVRIIEVAGAESVRVDLSFATALPDEPPATPKRPVAPSLPSRWTALSWAGIGAASALAVGAAVTGGLARSASDSAQSMRFVGEGPTAALVSRHSQAVALAATTDVLAGTAIALLATTVIVTLARKPEAPLRAPISLGVSPLGASLRGRF